MSAILRIRPILLLIPVLLLSACGSEPEARRYELRGQVLKIDAERAEVTIKHDAVEGYMAAMTMPFKVQDASELDGLQPGDLVAATLVVAERSAHLEDLRKIGHAQISTTPAAAPASSGFELLEPGEPVPDVELVNQDGEPLQFSALRGKAVALTFIYTRCPLPTFCPMLDRHFAEIQRGLDPSLKPRVQLLSVSFDPAYDTPPVLKAHAATLEADPAVWQFLTGDRDDIDRFGSRFGVMVSRDQQDPLDIAHNLRTVVVDPEGRLVRVYQGYDWKPEQVLEDLRAVSGGA